MPTINRMGAPDWPRFHKYVEKQDDGCWLWVGAIRGNGRNEYGAFWAQGTHRAHIVAYVWKYGEPDADLHHTCRNSLCVNPDHVTPAVAGTPHHRNPDSSFCTHGHEFTPENTYVDPKNGWRQCRACKRETTARLVAADRDAHNARRRSRREHITYDPRPCRLCGTVYQPKRSDSRFCNERACINERQRINRNGRLGR